MKKLSIIFMCIVFAFGIVTLGHAGSTSGGARVNMPDSGPGPGISFSPSPNVEIGWNSAAAEFCINAQNDKTNMDNGLEYGIWSGYSGYYQQQKVVAAAPDGAITAPTSTDGSFFSGWAQMGGDSS